MPELVNFFLLPVSSALTFDKAWKDPVVTKDGLDQNMQINCVSSALIEKILVTQEKNIDRVVHVSSLSSMSAPTNKTEAADIFTSLPFKVDDSAYGSTKLCQIGWAKRKNQNYYTSISLHPGGCATDIGEDAVSTDVAFPLMPLSYYKAVVRPLMMMTYHNLW